MSDQEPLPDFEQSIRELETILNKMDSGHLTLEESLKNFEQGIQLTQKCQKILDTAEQRVKVLIEENGEIIESELTSAT